MLKSKSDADLISKEKIAFLCLLAHLPHCLLLRYPCKIFSNKRTEIGECYETVSNAFCFSCPNVSSQSCLRQWFFHNYCACCCDQHEGVGFAQPAFQSVRQYK